MLLISPYFVLLILLGVSGIVSAGTQVDLRFAKDGFFLGQNFLITLSDVIYAVTGMCMGIIMAITFLFVSDYRTLKRRIDMEVEEEETNAIREGRLIGSKKYPTFTEERVLKSVHTEPDNYFRNSEDPQNNREGRLIGSKRLPTYMEYILKNVNDGPDNSFEDSGSREPRSILKAVRTFLKFSSSITDEFGKIVNRFRNQPVETKIQICKSVLDFLKQFVLYFDIVKVNDKMHHSGTDMIHNSEKDN